MTPAKPLTASRIATLPASEQSAWQAYLTRSDAQSQADHDALAAERQGMSTIPAPTREDSSPSMPLDRDANWYASPEARHIADVIISFQTPAGGWGKNAPRDGALRTKGQSYVVGDAWRCVGTFDNHATTTELQFLARVASRFTGSDGASYRSAFARGLAYVLAAQYPNGGWPQSWPLEGSYHDAVTFNDDALRDITGLLAKVAAGRNDFAFVPTDLRARASTAYDRAINLILATQVRSDGHLTAWGQQHDVLTLAPVGARNFEPAAFSSSESAKLLIRLMEIDRPSPQVIASVQAGIAWLRATAITGKAWIEGSTGFALVDDANAPLLWARYYSLDTGTPLFGDRDRTIHDDVMDLTDERRNGYAWYGTGPQKALDAYAAWSQVHPQ